MNIEVIIKVPVADAVNLSSDLVSAASDSSVTAVTPDRSPELALVPVLPPLPEQDLEAELLGPAKPIAAAVVETPPELDDLVGGRESAASASVLAAVFPPPSLEQIESWAVTARTREAPPELTNLAPPIGDASPDLGPPSLEELEEMTGAVRRENNY